jgi:hypothetical protein
MNTPLIFLLYLVKKAIFGFFPQILVKQKKSKVEYSSKFKSPNVRGVDTFFVPVKIYAGFPHTILKICMVIFRETLIKKIHTLLILIII